MEELLGRREEASGNDMHPFALDGLDHQRGDVTGSQLPLQRVEVTERDAGVG